MKISPKFKVRTMVGQNVIVMQGRYGGDMTKIISLNESSLFLWNTLHDREFTAEDAADALVGEYGIDAELARKDALAWCGKMAECGLLESCGETAEYGPHDDEASVGEGGADVR